MRNKKLFTIIVFLLIFGVLIIPIKATTTATISTITDKDSFVNSWDRYENYGDYDFFDVGKTNIQTIETYIHFDFTNKPDDWTRAMISINIYDIDVVEPPKITICLVNDNWYELIINWHNKQNHSSIITTFSVNEAKDYSIDISIFVEGRSDISICLYMAENYGGFIKGTSKEGATSDKIAPTLIWTYEVETYTGVLDIVPILVGLVILIGFIGVIIVISIKKGKSEPSKKFVPFQTYQKLEITPIFCPNCGRKVTKDEKFCMNCGYELL